LTIVWHPEPASAEGGDGNSVGGAAGGYAGCSRGLRRETGKSDRLPVQLKKHN